MYRLRSAIILMLISAAITTYAAEEALKLSTLEEALTYKGEKIVYIGIGTASSYDTFQALPACMEHFIREYGDICVCINIDDGWKRDIQLSIPAFKKRLGSSWPQFISRLRTVGIALKDHEPHMLLLEAYMTNVLRHGGVVFMGNCTGPIQIPHIMELFNKEQKLFPDQILLCSSKTFGPTLYWWDSHHYSLYDELLIRERFPARNDLAEEIIKGTLPRSIIAWYKEFFKTVTHKFYGNFRTLENLQGGATYSYNLFATPYEFYSDEQIIHDLLYKKIPCAAVFRGYTTVTFELVAFALPPNSDSYMINPPDLPFFDLFDLSSYKEIPALTVKRIKAEGAAGPSLHDELIALNQDLALFALMT